MLYLSYLTITIIFYYYTSFELCLNFKFQRLQPRMGDGKLGKEIILIVIRLKEWHTTIQGMQVAKLVGNSQASWPALEQ